MRGDAPLVRLDAALQARNEGTPAGREPQAVGAAIALAVMVFPSLPVVVPVEKKIVPKVVAVLDPWIVQFRTVLFVASSRTIFTLAFVL